jgi:hypothetical protein
MGQSGLNPEPITPSISETVEYINHHSTTKFSLSGTELKTTKDDPELGTRCSCWMELDLLNVEPTLEPIPEMPGMLWLRCSSGVRCMKTTSTLSGATSLAKGLIIEPKDVGSAPRLANAFGHLIRLLQQSSHPKENDPFAPK